MTSGCRLQGEVESYYHDKPRERKKLSQEKEFRQIKNAVIQEAERIRLGEISFEDDDLAEHDEPEQARDELPCLPGAVAHHSGTRTFLWTTVTGRRRSWSRWRSAATPMRNTGWDSSTGTVLC